MAIKHAVVQADKISRQVVKRYASIYQAEPHVPFSVTTLYSICYRKCLPKGRYYFRFEEEFDPDERFRSNARNRPIMAISGNRVRVFCDAHESAPLLGVTHQTMNDYAAKEKTISGITWKFLETPLKDLKRGD